MVENGEIGTVIVKDLSRFGRDHIYSGYYPQIKYPSLGVNFIVIQENVDVEKDVGTEMMPVHNIFNKWYARQTSKKIRAVWQNKRDRGERVSPTVPFGYKKAKKDPQWYIDEPAAETVRYIFKLAMEGLGPMKIANRLRKEKIVTPTEYYYSIERKTANPRPVDPYDWQQTTVKHIWDNRQYTGCAVNGKSSIVSYKLHKSIEYDESEWQIIPNMQEPIIDEETFNTRSSGQFPFSQIRSTGNVTHSPLFSQKRSAHHPQTPSPASPHETNSRNAFTTFCQNPRSIFDALAVKNETKSGENRPNHLTYAQNLRTRKNPRKPMFERLAGDFTSRGTRTRTQDTRFWSYFTDVLIRAFECHDVSERTHEKSNLRLCIIELAQNSAD